MVRQLKHHEAKLLKKVDLYDKDRRALEVIRRYHLQRREDYTKYNRICGQGIYSVAAGRHVLARHAERDTLIACHITERERGFWVICTHPILVKALATKLTGLGMSDATRTKVTTQLLERLYRLLAAWSSVSPAA